MLIRVFLHFSLHGYNGGHAPSQHRNRPNGQGVELGDSLSFVPMLPTFMIGMGLVYVFKKDWAWRIAEWGLRYVKPQRTPEWERLATINGVILIVGGLGIILCLLSMLPRMHLGR